MEHQFGVEKCFHDDFVSIWEIKLSRMTKAKRCLIPIIQRFEILPLLLQQPSPLHYVLLYLSHKTTTFLTPSLRHLPLHCLHYVLLYLLYSFHLLKSITNFFIQDLFSLIQKSCQLAYNLRIQRSRCILFRFVSVWNLSFQFLDFWF